MADSTSNSSVWTRSFFIVVPLLLGLGLALAGNSWAVMRGLDYRVRAIEFANERATTGIEQLQEGQQRLEAMLILAEERQKDILQRISRLEAKP